MPRTPSLRDAARAPAGLVLTSLRTSRNGLSSAEARRRAVAEDRNVIPRARSGPLHVLGAQLANPLLALLAVTAVVSLVLGESADAAIVLVIVAMSVGLGFFNEYRSLAVVADLDRRLRRTAVALRDGRAEVVDRAALVPGDVVALRLGDIVPADVRLIDAEGLECDEAVLTGEAVPAPKTADPVSPAGPLDLASCAFFGTVVRAGTGRGVVVRTGRDTEFGRIAARVGTRLPETAFQRGLRGIIGLLVRVTIVVVALVVLVNVVLRHSFFETLLFGLAIAVSLTPQLLPAIVTISLANGARRMARRQVLVKRLVAIEDLGNVEVLFTDKTGTLTLGRLAFREAVDVSGAPSERVLRLGIVCSTSPAGAVEAAGTTQELDVALARAPQAALESTAGFQRIAEVPFDHERRMVSVLGDDGDAGRVLIAKGAPEAILARCAAQPAGLNAIVQDRFASGYRVIAVAARPAPELTTLTADDERDLVFAGLLVFADPPKPDAAASLQRLAKLGVAVKIVTGDNELVATRVCAELGLTVQGVVTGAQIDALNDAALTALLPVTTVFARVSPDQKARLVRLQRAADVDVGFLGDGVNDAVALHDADVGISVESAADVARDAADVVLVTKDLGLLADGIVEGRRIFTNTVKYVLMAVSSNFGNMLSSATASMFLPFLPLLPSQVLLNNVLYDFSEMTISTDRVDDEQLRRPAHWDARMIGRFMLVFGPLSSLGDLAVFAVLLAIVHAGPQMFRAGYFAESFLTQTLIVFAIRTRRVPFFRSRPSLALTVTTLAVTAAGVALAFSPFAPFFGFARLGWTFVPVLTAIVAGYAILVEVTKGFFYRRLLAPSVEGSCAS
jgi:Mg2+-importing ATPase